MKKVIVGIAASLLLLTCVACSSNSGAGASSDNYAQNNEALSFDNTKWNYDSTNDVYWQVGVTYCATPQATDIETMGIYVPGAYMSGTANSDGTYTCSPAASGTVGSYTAKTAPIVIPVNTPGYSQSAAPTDYNYSSISDYLAAGFVYVQPGIRGRASMMGTSENLSYSDGAPWGVTDLKSAIRYCRFNGDLIPGNMDNIYTFGMSGGGAQSALVGATGDSALYTPYLEAIGSAMKDADGNAISDAVNGSMCWCPITSLDEADGAYEWNMGQFSSSGTRADTSFGSALSKDLAASYADYINALKLKSGGTELTLTESTDGEYQAGTYYDYILGIAETSLNNFLSDTTFPYTATQSEQFPGGSTGTMGGMRAGTASTGTTSSSSSTSGTTYNTVQDYIDSLNSDTEWVQYDATTNTAKITSLAAFAEHCKNATKSLGAFDELDRGQGENNLFGNGEGESYHFDATLAKLLKDNSSEYAAFSDWDSAYPTDYANDLTLTDDLGVSVQTRVDMYNPLYFLCNYYDGYGSSTVAKHWRIRTGAFQSDTALTVEANLALALENTSSVSDVDFATVWNMQHVMAERTGSSTTNFIDWVNTCSQS